MGSPVTPHLQPIRKHTQKAATKPIYNTPVRKDGADPASIAVERGFSSGWFDDEDDVVNDSRLFPHQVM